MKNRKTYRVTWDTYQNGCYFITICTKNRKHYFGKIKNNEMIYSALGLKIQKIIEDTIYIRNDQYIEIPIYTVMPNHIHFIITINYNQDKHQHHFGPQRKNLSPIIRGIKSSLTSYAIKNEMEFAWQLGFYEHIIQKQHDFSMIYDYIENNVMNWNKDRFQ